MADQDTTRKLAAILSADVVGYARLMGEDERALQRALALQQRDPCVCRHGVVKMSTAQENAAWGCIIPHCVDCGGVGSVPVL